MIPPLIYVLTVLFILNIFSCKFSAALGQLRAAVYIKIPRKARLNPRGITISDS